ncbi:HD domain-containing phosphohydrolase [Aeromonas molluscorum]|uniref:Chemotaxis sensory transducer family protein n=1 Tax=Aeromonas molluscorum 848 TaxID=1268236 RepID=R1GT49_9GAMM|nr:HD domain-containing phosphohydrolase [Aeromonas molluscorum]EOD54825.1 chemotaxis sensory transducer family protein [Aeromonas molluscorum 848]
MRLNGSQRRPFYVHIATLFICLFTLLGTLLIAQHFQQSRAQGMAHEYHNFQQYREQLALALTLNERPARTTLKLLRAGQLMQADDLTARLAFLPQLVEVLASQHGYGAIYVGYGNGDFFLVRTLTESVKAQLDSTPPGSSLLVQSLSGGQGKYLYYDARQRLLHQQPMPDYQFDPRARLWYQQALRSKGIASTAPYLFFTTKEPGMTLAIASPDGQAVIGIDASVDRLSRLIGKMRQEGTQLVLFDRHATLLATDPAQLPSYERLRVLPKISALSDPVFTLLQRRLSAEPDLLKGRHELTLNGENGGEWQVNLSSLGEGSPFYLGLIISSERLFANATREAWHNLGSTLLALLLLLPVIWLVARRTATPLLALTREAERIQHFDFSNGEAPHSAIQEIDDLSRTMSGMRLTLGNFMNMGRALGAEHNFDALLERVLGETIAAAGAEGGALYLVEEGQLQPALAFWHGHPLPTIEGERLLRPVLHGERLSVALEEGCWQRHLSGWGAYPGKGRLVAEPLRNHSQEVTGCLLILLPPCSPDELAARISLIEALAGTSASAIENQRLLAEQKRLLESFIELIAGAIDAKSPYTGGHCQRVPELTRLLAEAAAAEREGPFAGFNPSEQEWEAIHIASWLHDCGKVTTPEFVVDKATKLETLYDRIHEIRTRFEVLKRDAHIATLSEQLSEQQRSLARTAVAPVWAELDAEFSFVAECNQGEEWMAPERLEQLQRIATRSWLRTLDDRLGLGAEERKRHGDLAAPLPCREYLLADRPEHKIPRPDNDRLEADNSWGFKVKVPACLYDRGELYNLSIGRGTLSEEERYKINEHIIQTIKMLERLPFPRHLQQVPEIAGGHHEKMDGSGYPRGLSRAQMSVPARIMAIADIFEALTASDRPYKPGKSLSQSLAIMSQMANVGHIDPELFALFLRSRIWLQYGQRFLSEAQCDEVNLAAFRPPQGEEPASPSRPAPAIRSGRASRRQILS